MVFQVINTKCHINPINLVKNPLQKKKEVKKPCSDHLCLVWVLFMIYVGLKLQRSNPFTASFVHNKLTYI